MKKFLLMMLLALLEAMPCFAGSEIVIKKADKDEVLQFATNLYLMVNNQYALERQGESTVFLTTAKIGEGPEAYEEKLSFVANEKDEGDVLLEIHDAKLRRDDKGKMVFEQISRPGPERFYLSLIKSMFNDHYTFGYTLSATYKDGGFAFDDVMKGFPMELAGIKDGDILVAVNKVEIKPEDEAMYNDVALPSAFTGKATEFMVLRGGDKLTFVVKPKAAKAALKNKKEEDE